VDEPWTMQNTSLMLPIAPFQGVKHRFPAHGYDTKGDGATCFSVTACDDSSQSITLTLPQLIDVARSEMLGLAMER